MSEYAALPKAKPGSVARQPMPEQDPQDGQALFSSIFNRSAVILPL